VLDRFRAVDHPDTLSNGFAFLMIELSDPEFHVLAAESANNAIAGYRTMLEAAVEAGELEGSVGAQHLAETIHALTWGALMMWAIIRMLSPQDRLKRSLDILLTPYRREVAGATSSFATKTAAKGPETIAPVPPKN
jgi:hypothetical protein